MDSPKISIIIPVYNVEKHLESCLESVVNQSFKDIEIICVNDCSTDNSMDILKKYAEKDNRIIVIDKTQNEGTMLARKSGVSAAKGKYIIFIDADDYIKEDLCQFVNDITAKECADVIQFCIDIDGYSVNNNDVEWMRNAFKPIEKRLNASQILSEAFITRKCTTSLVGKIFKAELCKKVNEFLPYEKCYVGEDIFTYFIFANFAESYIGINTKGYYVYRYGLGVENSKTMPISKFEQYCKMSNWVEYAEKFLIKNGSDDLKKQALEKMAVRMCEDCCKIYKNRISDIDKENAAILLTNNWQNIDITDKVMQSVLGTSLQKFAFQASVPVYYKTAAAYTDIKPKVSVVIPIYNVEEYLKECLDSVIKQTLKEIEIICVNDGSPDNSLQIIEEYAQKDNRITIVSRKNGGLSAARNSGIQYARGKYIYFLDSDDFISEDTLKKLYDISEENKLDILYFGVQNYFENEDMKKYDIKEDTYYQRKQFFDTAVKGDVLFEKFLDENMFICCVPFQFIRGEFLINSGVRFKEGILHEDELFSPQLILEAENTMVIEDKFYMRRIREDSIMTTVPTYRNFIGYFIAFTGLVSKGIICDKYSKTAKDALNLYTKKLYNTSRRIYKQLTDEQKKLVDLNLPQECKLLFQPIKDYETLINSLPYRAGMSITLIPRKINATLKALKEKGIKGTWQLIKKYYLK